MTLILSGTDGLSDVDGSAATPAIRGTDANTGIFFPAADTIAFAEGGVEAMRIDSSGNVGIGTSSPQRTLHVENSSGNLVRLNNSSSANGSYSSIELTSTGGNNCQIRGVQDSSTAGHLEFYTLSASAVSERMRIDSSGNVGIGQTPVNSRRLTLNTSGQTDLSIVAGSTSYAQLLFGYTGADNKGIVAYNNSDNSMQFYTNSSERARIDSSGNLLVGTTTSGGAGATSGLTVINFNGAAVNGLYMSDTRTSAGLDVAVAFGRGTTVVGRLDTTLTSLTLTNLSDQRVKTNIQDSGNAIGLVGSIKVRQFDWTIDESHEDFGFVAQELNDVFPQAVSVGKTEEEMWGVNFVKLVPILTKAIQEQQAIITQLQADVAALKGTA